jgi:hypothetical protein
MEIIKINDFIKKTKISIPDIEKFRKLNSFFPIDPNKPPTEESFERGMLLYTLISKYKPKTVLEIGTAQGYSTLCMAWAMSDMKISGKIFTIDPNSHNEPIDRTLNIDNQDKVENLSRKEIWEKFAEPEWLEKIIVKTGYSGKILSSESFPKIDFAFIDGHHYYKAVIHDFFATMKIASKHFRILFDDYVKNDYEGANKIIDKEVLPNFEATLIKSNIPDIEHFLCLIDSEFIKKPLENVFPKNKINSTINEYINWENRFVRRQKLNSKIPFLKKIRFSKFLGK